MSTWPEFLSFSSQQRDVKTVEFMKLLCLPVTQLLKAQKHYLNKRWQPKFMAAVCAGFGWCLNAGGRGSMLCRSKTWLEYVLVLSRFDLFSWSHSRARPDAGLPFRDRKSLLLLCIRTKPYGVALLKRCNFITQAVDHRTGCLMTRGKKKTQTNPIFLQKAML